jgi:hypothetical protein
VSAVINLTFERREEVQGSQKPRSGCRGNLHARVPNSLSQHDPRAYIRDVLERLPLQPASRIDELLPLR